MINYLIQIIGAQLIFLVIYESILKKETFFSMNRAYLLLTYCISFIIPFAYFPEISNAIVKDAVIKLPSIFLTTQSTAPSELLNTVFILPNSGLVLPSLSTILLTAWASGAMLTLGLLVYKLYQISKIRKLGTHTRWGEHSLVVIPHSTAAFSFFNSIYVGDELPMSLRETICHHEHVHIKEGHSIDLIILELLKVLLWFNPLSYRYQNLLEELHEYKADAITAQIVTKSTYYEELLSQVFNSKNISFVNTFFNQSLIKKRIIMLQKSRSNKYAQLKFILLLPLLSLMLIYTSCTLESTAQSSLNDDNSLIIQKVEEIKEEIAKKGNLSENDEKALKGLLLLVTDDGFSNPMFDDVIPDAHIPFGVIDKVPVYPGCENLNNEETKSCFISKITELVSQEFNTKIAKDNKLSGQQKVYAYFTVGNDGRVKNIKAESTSDILKAEAIRVVEKLPVMQAGEQKGKQVNVEYTLPIIFEVE